MSPLSRLLALVAFVLVASVLPSSAQGQEVPQLSDAALTLYATVHGEILELRDEMHLELSRVANKIDEAQVEIRAEMRERILAVFEAHGMPEEEYDAITFILSVDEDQQERFRAVQASLRGQDRTP